MLYIKSTSQHSGILFTELSKPRWSNVIRYTRLANDNNNIKKESKRLNKLERNNAHRVSKVKNKTYSIQ